MDQEVDYVVGVDLGKVNDPAIFTACRRCADPESADGLDHVLEIRVLHKADLGTNYNQVVDDLADLVNFIRTSEKAAVCVGVDATGVGQAVLDTVRSNDVLKDCCWGITSTSGQNLRRNSMHPNDVNVPKKDVVGAVLVALQNGRVRAHPTLPNLQELKEQLLQFHETKRSRVTSFEGDGETHDDFVMSLGNAAWLATYVEIQSYEGDGGTAVAPYPIDSGFQARRGDGPSWRDKLPR